MISVTMRTIGLGAALALAFAGCSYVNLGVMGGLSRHEGDVNITDSDAGAFESHYTSRGAAVGFDLQCAQCEVFKVDLIFFFSTEIFDEGSRGRYRSNYITHGGILAQFRTYLWDQVVVGAHRGRYSVGFTPKIQGDNNSRTVSGSGDGMGLVVGWDPVDYGFYSLGQYDSYTIDTFDSRNKNQIDGEIEGRGYLILAGYRWR